MARDTRLRLFGKNSSGGGRSVRFEITPQVSEQASSILNEISEIRAPASILIWMGSPARTFNINAKLLSRTPEEAEQSFKDKNLLSSWRMPENMDGDAAGFGIMSYPSTVTLWGYNGMFRGIPTLMSSINFEWPDDVDYVRSTSGVYMPILMNVSISLKEAQATESELSFSDFNIKSFRAGTLKKW